MEEKMISGNTLLTAYLNEYIKMTKPQFAVMITGKWGCGKTYYIDSIISEWEKDKEKDDDEDCIQLKPVYVSVYGMKSISDVVRQIKTKLNPVLYSKGVKIAKKVALTALQILAKSKLDVDGDGTGEDLNTLLDAEGILEIFKSDSSSIKGNKILVFDDLERGQIPMDEFFGFVNSIVEHSNSKVILICDEEKLKASTEKDDLKVKYKDFKEKLIGQTFSLEVDYAQIAASFINASGEKVLTDNLKLIVDLFVASKCENLRIIKHCLLDIIRLLKQLPDGVEKNANYSVFVKNVVAYLVITSIEDRFGNKDIEGFQSYNFLKKATEEARNNEGKYLPTLEYHKLYHSTYSIPVHTLLTFVRTGFLYAPERVVAGSRLLMSRSLTNWEKLWRYTSLSNDDFLDLLKSEKERFYKKELEYAFEVAHVAGILLSLEKRGVVKLSRKYIVGIAKKNIAQIHKLYPTDITRLAMDDHGYDFRDSDSSEMNEIFALASSLMQKQEKDSEEEYIVKAWNQLNAGMTVSEIEALFDQTTPTRRCSYSMMNIFTQVNPQNMAEKIVSLPNATKDEFASFLVDRYYLKGAGINGTISTEMKNDKESLKKISDHLKSKAKRLKLIDKEQTLLIASKMDEAVGKM